LFTGLFVFFLVSFYSFIVALPARALFIYILQVKHGFARLG